MPIRFRNLKKIIPAGLKNAPNLSDKPNKSLIIQPLSMFLYIDT